MDKSEPSSYRHLILHDLHKRRSVPNNGPFSAFQPENNRPSIHAR